jgi:hypothetical protein
MKYCQLESPLVLLPFISGLRGTWHQDSANQELKENDYGPANKEVHKHRVYAIKIRRGNQRPTEQNQTKAKDQRVKLMPAE